MAEKGQRAPASGEIITKRGAAPKGCARAEAFFAGPDDILDAEYETLTRETGEETTTYPPAPTRLAAAAAGLDMLRGGGHAPPGRALSGGAAFWAAGLVLVGGVFWFSGGHAMLGPASDVGAAGALRIAGLESRIEGTGEMALLLVDGEAVNDGRKVRHLPDLSISVLDKEGRTTHYFLGTNGRALAAGGRFSFSGRLAAPKDGVKSVSVTFREYSD